MSLVRYVTKKWSAASSIQSSTIRSPIGANPFARFAHSSSLSDTAIAHADVSQDLHKTFCKTDIYNVSEAYSIFTALKARYPDFSVTMVDESAGLLDFAEAGQAKAVLEKENSNLLSWLKYDPKQANAPKGATGKFRDLVHFGRYDYCWKGMTFIVYLLSRGYYNDPPTSNTYFVLHRRTGDHIVDGRSSITKDLIAAASIHTNDVQEGDVLVWDDDEWTKSAQLWATVQKSDWEKVILEKSLKEALLNDIESFFDQRDAYRQYEVPYKRGVLIHGLPGNGKTCAVKALIKTLSSRPIPIPTLYVKSSKGSNGSIYAIRKIFKKARKMAPCLLVFEDLDSLITEETRSFFLNEVDGLESNDGILMIGSTNYLEKLDAGLTKRPSRFDRKYHFDLPAAPERTRYCEFWRSRLADNKSIVFPAKMCSAIAGLTDGFSFAYLQEIFISSLLVLLREQQDNTTSAVDDPSDADTQNLESVLFWRVICRQVEILRNEIKGSRKSAKDALEYIGPKQATRAGFS